MQVKSVVDGLQGEFGDVVKLGSDDAKKPANSKHLRDIKIGGNHGAVARDHEGNVVWKIPGHEFGEAEIREGIQKILDAAPKDSSAALLTTEQIQAVLQAAVAQAEAKGVAVTVTVIDSRNALVGQTSMDGTEPSSIEASINRAHVAMITGDPTGSGNSKRDYGKALRKHPDPKGKKVGGMLTFKFDGGEGGIPLIVDDAVLGGVGIAGAGKDTVNLAIAEAAAQTISQ
jgi:uncharacterized protein GlcG (DUF336 family)